jgi:hypothetical protein
MKEYFKTQHTFDDVLTFLNKNSGYLIYTTKGCFITQDPIADKIFESKILVDVNSHIDSGVLENENIIPCNSIDNAVEVIPIKFVKLQGVYCCDSMHYSESVIFGLDYVVNVIKF